MCAEQCTGLKVSFTKQTHEVCNCDVYSGHLLYLALLYYGFR